MLNRSIDVDKICHGDTLILEGGHRLFTFKRHVRICLHKVTLSLSQLYLVLNNYYLDASTLLDLYTPKRLAV